MTEVLTKVPTKYLILMYMIQDLTPLFWWFFLAVLAAFVAVAFVYNNFGRRHKSRKIVGG
jgi:hypothetical protein